MLKKAYLMVVIVALSACSSPSTTKKSQGEDQGEKKSTASKAKTFTSQEDISEKVAETTCTLKNDVRVLSHIKLTDGGCSVSYSKFGEISEAAKARYNLDHCSAVYDRIRGNLESAGFDCN